MARTVTAALLLMTAAPGRSADEPRSAWVDTDGLNGPNGGLHYTNDGYAELGRRFAAETVCLLQKAAPKE